MPSTECSIRQLVAGATAFPSDVLVGRLTDPDTGAELHEQRSTSAADLERALDAADRVHSTGAWSDLPRTERAAALRRLGRELAERVEVLARADSLDTGVPLTTTTALIGAVCASFDVAADEVASGFGHEERTSESGPCDQWRLPWGPAAVLLPWNAPTAMMMTRTADALLAGGPVLLKPSEWSPHSSGPFAAAVSAALPDGVVQLVHGDRAVSAALVEDPRVAAVSFTGGVAGGRAVAEACARQLKPVDLELSGNNAVVVLPDADADLVVEQVLAAMLFLNGQYCAGPRRLVVPAGRRDELLALLAAALDGVTVGPTADPATVLGPLAHAGHLAHVQRQLADFESRGCEVRRHGTRPDGPGHFLAPTTVLADPAPDLRDEVFGPVLVVRTYTDVDDAVRIANDSPYGLSGYVFGADRDRAREVGRRLRAGIVRLNSAFGPPDVAPVGSPWGQSGLGSFGPGEGSRFLTGSRFVG